MPNKYDKLATRTTQILKYFNDGYRLTVREMAEEFDVCERTIQRDLGRLSSLPIEKNKGSYFLGEYALGKLGFKDIKNFSNISDISKLYPKLDAMTITDILNPKTNSSMKIKGYNYENLSTMSNTFDNLGTAIISHLKVVFLYKDKTRKVNPYKLFNTQGIWYLLGLEKGILKHYAFSKIKYLSLTQKKFKVDKKIRKTIEENKLTWITQDPIEVTLRIDATVAEYFQRRELLSSQKILEEHSTHIVIQATVTFEEELLRIARYWVPHIHIISPAHLQEKLEDSLKSYLNY